MIKNPNFKENELFKNTIENNIYINEYVSKLNNLLKSHISNVKTESIDKIPPADTWDENANPVFASSIPYLHDKCSCLDYNKVKSITNEIKRVKNFYTLLNKINYSKYMSFRQKTIFNLTTGVHKYLSDSIGISQESLNYINNEGSVILQLDNPNIQHKMAYMKALYSEYYPLLDKYYIVCIIEKHTTSTSKDIKGECTKANRDFENRIMDSLKETEAFFRFEYRSITEYKKIMDELVTRVSYLLFYNPFREEGFVGEFSNTYDQAYVSINCINDMRNSKIHKLHGLGTNFPQNSRTLYWPDEGTYNYLHNSADWVARDLADVVIKFWSSPLIQNEIKKRLTGRFNGLESKYWSKCGFYCNTDYHYYTNSSIGNWDTLYNVFIGMSKNISNNSKGVQVNDGTLKGDMGSVLIRSGGISEKIPLSSQTYKAPLSSRTINMTSFSCPKCSKAIYDKISFTRSGSVSRAALFNFSRIYFRVGRMGLGVQQVTNSDNTNTSSQHNNWYEAFHVTMYINNYVFSFIQRIAKKPTISKKFNSLISSSPFFINKSTLYTANPENNVSTLSIVDEMSDMIKKDVKMKSEE